MQLTVYNGSPRGQKSNTRLLLERFLSGFEGKGGETHRLHYLVKRNERKQQVEDFASAPGPVLLAFPLYTDCMPGLVKDFIEDLRPLCGQEGLPPAMFLVQSGFPEAHHSRFVERYLEKLTRRLGCGYLGTMVRGGVEGIQVMPPVMTRKLYGLMEKLGAGLAQTKKLNPGLLRKLAHPEKLSPMARWMYEKLLYRISNNYWSTQLKKNNALDRREDRPFAEKT
jgi:hypothetical protein